MEPRVLHIDIDAFFASVEQIRNPVLRGRPVAVGSGVVASASYEARRFGLRAGMPLREARKRCPGLEVLAGHAAVYRCFSERIFRICARYAPAMETYLDEAYCDWTGTERLYPDPIRVAGELKERLRLETGLTVSAGIGRTRMFAKMATRSAKPDGLRCITPREEETFLASLPVAHLPGVGPRTEALLARLNIRTIGNLRVLSRESLRCMLGLPGELLYQRCRGVDTRAVSPREIPRSISRETTFHQDTIERHIIEGTLYYLLERAANTLRRLQLQARRLSVKIRYRDFTDRSATQTLPDPTQLDSELAATATGMLEKLATRRVALRLVGVTLSGLQPEQGLRQLDLFPLAAASLRAPPQDEAPSPRGGAGTGIVGLRRERRLLESLDAIRLRYGYSSVVCGKSLHLSGKLPQDEHGFILRTSSLTQ